MPSRKVVQRSQELETMEKKQKRKYEDCIEDMTHTVSELQAQSLSYGQENSLDFQNTKYENQSRQKRRKRNSNPFFEEELKTAITVPRNNETVVKYRPIRNRMNIKKGPVSAPKYPLLQDVSEGPIINKKKSGCVIS